MKNLSTLPLLALLSCTPSSAVDLTDTDIELTTTLDETTTLPDATTSTTTDHTPTTTTPDPITTTTTDDATTTSTTTAPDATTEPLPSCGDAHVDPGEQCDHGPGNGNSNSCTALCQYAVCGDRLINHGIEQCDLGPDNNGALYDWCDENCQRTNYCGDGIRHETEECDFGAKNGTGNNDSIDGVPCSQQCDLEANIVFLSSLTYRPDELDSAALADLRCQHLALYGNLPNADNFHAWISDDVSTPLDRLAAPVPGYPYALITGQRVAVDRDTLLTTGPELGITRTELGDQIFDAPVWTDTTPDGQQFAIQQDCSNWTSDSPQQQARVGRSGIANPTPEQLSQWRTSHWTSHITLTCAAAYRLYCFEG